MLKTPELKIGTNKSNAYFMKALVYDFEDGNIIISQTSPALDRHFLNREVMVSFLARIDRRNLRFGFLARLIDLVNDYKIASGKIVEALVLQQHKESEPVDFRMYFRVKPGLQSDISLILKEEKVNVLDISLGGARFTCPRDYSFRSADKIKFKLLIGNMVFDLDTIVREVWTPYDVSVNGDLQYVSVEFEYYNKHLEAALGKAIIDIERQLLSEGKI